MMMMMIRKTREKKSFRKLFDYFHVNFLFCFLHLFHGIIMKCKINVVVVDDVLLVWIVEKTLNNVEKLEEKRLLKSKIDCT